MLGILYLALAVFVGYNLLKIIFPGLFNISKTTSLRGKPIRLPNWMVTLPSGFLTGTLLITWLTYMSAWIFKYFFPSTVKPLIFGDIVAFSIFTLLALFFIIKHKQDYIQLFKAFKKTDSMKYMLFISNNKLELLYVFILFAVWNFFMFRSFKVEGGNILVGYSTFSDFGATLSIIRSFSFGSNFPSEYPHFASGVSGVNDIRYHFLFQFLAGNLEFLGLRIDWAFNLPSILSIVSFLMLLYSFAVIIIGERWVGILTAILFFFRSSFAFFTKSAEFKQSGLTSPIDIFNNLLKTSSSYIGKTEHESWGFWTMNVFVNKRHYSFALGLILMGLIIIFPLFKKMMDAFKKTWSDNRPKKSGTKAVKPTVLAKTLVEEVQIPLSVYLKGWVKEFILSKNAWLPENILRSLVIGILLGLLCFWNGAVVIGVLPVLFLIAIFSKHRLEFLIIAVLMVVLSLLQSNFFTEGDTAGKPELWIGFLAPNGTFSGIFNYYTELLGILPFVLLAGLITVPLGGRLLTLAFLSPLVLATTFKFSLDVGANHVIVIFSIILLNILVADFLYRLFTSKRLTIGLAAIVLTGVVFYALSQTITFMTPDDPQKAIAQKIAFDSLINTTIVVFLIISAFVVLVGLLIKYLRKSFDIKRVLPVAAAMVLFIMLTLTGFIDSVTLYNTDKGYATEFSTHDPLIEWASKNTDPKDTFLIIPTFTHRVLMAGRKVYSGGLYFTSTAGYNPDSRTPVINEIYGGTNPQAVKNLSIQENIKYIVIDQGNRDSTDYMLNENLFIQNFEKVFEEGILINYAFTSV